MLALASLWWERASFSSPGSLLLSALFPVSLARLLLMSFAPGAKRVLKERFFGRVLPRPMTEFELPFSAEQAATLLARTFKNIGSTKFARIVMVFGHGASSVNNPFAAAYNCGACGGRDGGPNARLLARLANHPGVRNALQQHHSICIPDDTVFVGALHNTTAETIEFFDVEAVPPALAEQFAEARRIIEEARGQNALERVQRFLLAKNVHSAEEALRFVLTRSTDAAEVRPELNHASNAAVVIGRRSLTKGLFLDRRVFLPSYDPLGDDARGTNLEGVLTPALIVCSGINLEYLFSTIDVDHHGAGTKVPLNIVGNIGVLQGTTGDLRPGLPSQMTEMHTPLRALFVVDAPVERVEAVLVRRRELCDLVRNEWVQLVVRDPTTGVFYRQSRGMYFPIEVEEFSAAEPIAPHATQGISVARREDLIFKAAAGGMALACGVPVYLYGATAMNPHGVLIALAGTALSMPVLAFARRYLHGEFMFGRFSLLTVGLTLGFSMVAVAPSLHFALSGWTLFGLASVFLIGAYNDRPTVRNNATFAFAAYQISDLALLSAVAYSAPSHHDTLMATAQNAALLATSLPPEHANLVAASLLLAAAFKSSQFPLTSLFVRSMEGPTPASALGYAGLSAHVGVVLLTR